jgi:outer membrane protein
LRVFFLIGFLFKKNISMKKLILLGVVAFVILFSNCKNNKNGDPSVKVIPASDTTAAVKAAILSAAKIVYVNIDSLQERYTWFKQQKAVFEQREKSLASSIESKAQSLQRDMIALQQKAQQGTTPPATLQQEEQQLIQRQQSIANERDRRGQDLMVETQKFNEILQKKVSEVLEQLQKEKGFDFVVSYSKAGGSPFLYVNNSLDVTNEVLTILNAQKAQ